MHVDFLGNTLEVGDEVILPWGSIFDKIQGEKYRLARIVELCDYGVRVVTNEREGSGSRVFSKEIDSYPSEEVIKCFYENKVMSVTIKQLSQIK